MKLQDLDTSCRYRGRLLASVRITPEQSPVEVRELQLAVPEELAAVEAGQSVGVIVPGDPELAQAEHMRLYTVADLPQRLDDGAVGLKLCVRRCDYIDAYSGERYPGRASHYLCDLDVGQPVLLTGPYGDMFRMPEDPQADLILIAAGTGIAPFRAFIRHIDRDHPEFGGNIRLFQGGRTGLELLYRNEVLDELSHYNDREAFQAITALASRPHWSDDIDWAAALEPQAESIREALLNPHTYVYLAGTESIRDEIDAALGEIFGGAEAWTRRKAELVAGGRWNELLY
jgi:ferredoxin--NADP+ reductase